MDIGRVQRVVWVEPLTEPVPRAAFSAPLADGESERLLLEGERDQQLLEWPESVGISHQQHPFPALPRASSASSV